LPVVYEVRALWEDAFVSNGTTTEGSARYRLTRMLESFVVHHARAVATICEGLKQELLERGVPEGKIFTVPNGVDLRRFPYLNRENRSDAATSLRRSLLLDRKIVLGFFGSFYPYEGLDLLLTALPEILRLMPDIRVLLVGGGQAESALKEQARKLGIDDVVRFVGRVPHDEIINYYELADVFVFPRRTSRLTELVTPLKPLEAMATGGVVFASNVGGHRELITPGETGYVFDADDPSILARDLAKLVANIADWPNVHRRARRFVESQRNWTVCAANYESVYSTALGRAPQ
jgi:PEP-CTERM/exosortase A-associated glycosyltransferase